MGLFDALQNMTPEQTQGLLATGLGILASNKGNYGQFGGQVGQGGLIGLQNLQQQTKEKNQLGLATRGLNIQDAYKKMQEDMIAEQILKTKQAMANQAKVAQFMSPQQPQAMPGPMGPLPPQGPQQGAPMPPQGAMPMPQQQAPMAPDGGPLGLPPLANSPIQAPPVSVDAKSQPNYQAMAAEAKDKAMKIMAYDPKLGNDLLVYSAQMDKLGKDQDADKKPLFQMVSIGDGKEQLHQWNPTSGMLVPVAGSKPRDIFNPQSMVTINNKQETVESQTVGKGFGEEYNKIQQAGFNASSKINNLGRLSQLLEGVETGKLTPSATNLAAYAESIGFKVDPKLPNKQAALALSNEIALQLRNPSGGAGMPGAMSDKDREFLVSMTPGIEQTPEGRKLIIETGIKLAKRDQDVARLARAYRKENGHMDEGFSEVLAEFSAAHPLFDTPKTDSAWTPDKEKRLRELEQRHAK